jgi:phosphoglycolate phosphatase-like HAD superfamily hydrolase
MPRPLYIFDLDGTLADLSHRRHFLDKKDWRGFFAACDKDAPIQNVIDTAVALWHAGNEVWIFSGRSDECQDKTIQWLYDNTWLGAKTIENITMRRAGDTRPDDIVKREFYDNMLEEDKQRLVAIFDDRDRVVNMWRSLGLTCFQVAPGNF